MEFLAWKTLNQVIREANYDQTWLTQFTVDTFIEHIRMASLTWFFHADLHPANIVILENDKIGLLDFWSVGYFAEDQRWPFILYMLGSVMYDVDIAVRGAVILWQPPEGFDREEFRARSAQVMDWFRDVTAKEMTPTQYLLHGIQIMLDYGGLFPPVVPLYARSSANLDGIIRSLNPDYILAYPMRAVMFQTYKDHKLANARLVPRVILLLEELLDVVEDSPEKIREIIDRVFSQEV